MLCLAAGDSGPAANTAGDQHPAPPDSWQHHSAAGDCGDGALHLLGTVLRMLCYCTAKHLLTWQHAHLQSSLPA